MGILRYKYLFSYGVALVVVGLTASSPSVEAQQTFTVTRGDDPVPSEEGTLRWAVEQANTTPGTDVVSIDGESIGFSDRDEFVREAAIELSDRIDVTESLKIASLSTTSNDRIRVVGSGESRIFSFTPIEQDEERVLELWDLDIENGRTQAPGVPLSCGSDSGQGGAICALGHVFLRSSTVTDSSTSGDSARGGAIWSSDTVRLMSSRISDNYTSGREANGGGVAAQNVTCIQSIVGNNRTEGEESDGGGISAEMETFGNFCRVRGNQTLLPVSDGGGIFTRDLRTLSDVSGFDVSNNTAAGGFGGGAFVRSRVNVSQSTFSGNLAQTAFSSSTPSGNALFFSADGSEGDLFLISRSTVVTPPEGAAIALPFIENDSFAAEIRNTVLVNNSDSEAVTPSPGIDVSTLSGQTVEVVQRNNYPQDLTSNILSDRVMTDLRSSEIACAVGLGEFLSKLIVGGECMAGHEPLPGSSIVDQADDAFLPDTAEWDSRGKGFDRIVGAAMDIGSIESSEVITFFVANSFSLGDTMGVELVAPGAVCRGFGLPETEWNSNQFVSSSFTQFPPADSSGLSLDQLGLTIEDLPAEVTVGINCALDIGEASFEESRERIVTIFPEEAEVLEIETFDMSPSVAVKGNPVWIQWNVIGEGPSCEAGGLPGTAWDGLVQPSGAMGIDTSSLEPGQFEVILSCSTMQGFVRETLMLELIPSTRIDLAAFNAGSFLSAQYGVFEVLNAGASGASALTLSVDLPAGAQAEDVFSLLPVCSLEGGESSSVRCQSPQNLWDCQIIGSQVECQLDSLLAGETSGIVVQVPEGVQGVVSGQVSAFNAPDSTTTLEINN